VRMFTQLFGNLRFYSFDFWQMYFSHILSLIALNNYSYLYQDLFKAKTNKKNS
jgi:hypothetical protein